MNAQPAPTDHPPTLRPEQVVDGMALTVEQFLNLPDTGDKHELVNGRLATMTPPGYPHSEAQANILFLLVGWVRTSGRGRAGGEMSFQLTRDTVRGPDAYWVAEQPSRDTRKIDGAPDLAVEIRSPRDSWKALKDKAAEYLEYGARMVWLIDPERRLVEVHAPAAEPVRLEEADTLDGGDLLPGFSVPVAEIFA